MKCEENGDECVFWQGHTTKKGYGRATVQGRKVLAHRLVWEQKFGKVPKGHVLHHTCGNKSCVNTEHLILLTASTHSSMDNGQQDKTHCPKGHEYTLENTRFYKGRRFCRECQRERNRNAVGRATYMRDWRLRTGRTKKSWGTAK